MTREDAWDETIMELEEDVGALRNGCEQALLLLERDRFAEDPECKVVRAVLRSALNGPSDVLAPFTRKPSDRPSSGSLDGND